MEKPREENLDKTVVKSYLNQAKALDISVVMPCLNEETTVGLSVIDAMKFMEKNSIKGEVIVVDNGSEDNSAKIAAAQGAIVISEPRRGYGRALRTGFENAQGKVVIMGDCDTTYDFLNMETMYQLLQNGSYDMVIGNRYSGGIEKGAMPWSHRWGVKLLSFLGRKKFKVNIYDFHCGIRGFKKTSLAKLELKTEGMEFATELIAEASRKGFTIKEIPVPLKKCELKRKSKLRTIRDGLRHLIYIIKA